MVVIAREGMPDIAELPRPLPLIFDKRYTFGELTKDFLCFLCQDRDKWKSRVGDTLLPDFSYRVPLRHPENTNTPCQACISMASGTDNRTRIVRSSAACCRNNRCEKCCAT